MHRNYSPFNGKRFILNTNTGEIHDLDHETDACKIDSIKHEHIYACDTYHDAELYQIFITTPPCNGCHYCIPSKGKG